MTPNQLASLLNGIDVNEEITKDTLQIAKENGLVIVFVTPQNTVVFCGAISDYITVPTKTSSIIVFSGGGGDATVCTLNPFDCQTGKKYISAIPERRNKIYCTARGGSYKWTFESEIEASTFDTLKDGKPFCRGFVFSCNSVANMI